MSSSDFDAGRRIFIGEFTDEGTQVGAVVVGGIRFAGRGVSAGFEVRYHHADAALVRPTSPARAWIWAAGRIKFTAGVRF